MEKVSITIEVGEIVEKKKERGFGMDPARYYEVVTTGRMGDEAREHVERIPVLAFADPKALPLGKWRTYAGAQGAMHLALEFLEEVELTAAKEPAEAKV